MSVQTYGGKSISINDEGFLLDASQWTPAVGEDIAREIGLSPLNDKQWQVITFCREDAAREGQSPNVRRIAKLSGVTMKELYQLFPKGPGKLASRIAGLPKPQGCI